MMDRSIQEKRKNKEIKYVFQFALCMVCCITTWVSFRIFSLIGIPKGPIYLILTTFQILHSGTNSIVFLIFNKDVQEKFRLYILRHDMKRSETCTQSPSVTNGRTSKKFHSNKYEYNRIESSWNNYELFFNHLMNVRLRVTYFVDMKRINFRNRNYILEQINICAKLLLYLLFFQNDISNNKTILDLFF